ncbi:unnamed protein product, partial [Pylaiella littoralis]
VEGAWRLGCSTPEVLTESVARVLYLLAVREVAGEFSDRQQAAIPWTAQAFGVKMRCFHPGELSGVSGGLVLGCFQEDDVREYEQIAENAWRHHVG